MRVVLDTNIVARAVISKNGPAAECPKRLLSNEHVLIVSPPMLAELERVLAYPRLQAIHRMTEVEIGAVVADLAEAAEVVDYASNSPSPIVGIDSNDESIIATAVSGGVSILCILDRHFYDAEVVAFCGRHGVRIVNDLELLDELRRLDSGRAQN
jgi:putative PIN family toxin of toxin-antitoxin system